MELSRISYYVSNFLAILDPIVFLMMIFYSLKFYLDNVKCKHVNYCPCFEN